MRLRDYIRIAQELAKDSTVGLTTKTLVDETSSWLNYVIQHTGRNRRQRRALAVNADKPLFSAPPTKVQKPKNWTRDRHQRRKVQKARRKQAWKGR